MDRFAGVSLLAACGLAWCAVIGMPRVAPRATAFQSELAGAALVVPPLAAAAGLDTAQGADPSRTIALAVGILVVAVVLGDAARRAARDRRSARAHAVAWTSLVAAPPLLFYALEVGGGPFLGRAPAFVAWLGRASPLGAFAADVPDVFAPVHASPVGPLVLVLVASAAAWRGALPFRRAPDEAPR